MDSTLKLCTTLPDAKLLCSVDRISSLPDELLIQILSFLPSKDAVGTSVLRRRWKHLFTWITSLNFEDLPISHCLHHPHRLECSPTFVKFVDNVLQACQSEKILIRRFSLRFGKGKYTRSLFISRGHRCVDDCFPDLKPSHLNEWMCFPLTRGVRELDLCIHLKKPGKLPQEIFTCETLRVLKIDAYLHLEVPMSFCLSYLKVLHLNSVHIPDGESMTRLVLSCPSLEDLTVKDCYLKDRNVINIPAPSLRRLVIDIIEYTDDERNDVVLATPNLQYFHYCAANLASWYSFGNLNAVVEADIRILFLFDDDETSCDTMLSLLRPLSNVQHLSLLASCVQALQEGDIKTKLPVFRNLSNLQLGLSIFNKWHKVLLELLNCMPLLERLAFPEGLIKCNIIDEGEEEIAELEYQYWSTTQAIPPCFLSHLKRIEIDRYRGLDWELELVKYFLRNASVLEELVICQRFWRVVDIMSLESTLKKLPRSSITCSIKCNVLGTPETLQVVKIGLSH